jgi:methylmalonyl-CoA mutase cobalamin-binding subunit
MPNALFAEFPPVSPEEWAQLIEKDLKGKVPSGRLFYCAADVEGLPVGVDAPRGWRTLAEVATAEEAREALARGAEGLVVEAPDASWLPLLTQATLHTAAPLEALAGWAAALRGTWRGTLTLEEWRRWQPVLPGFRLLRFACADDGTRSPVATLAEAFEAMRRMLEACRAGEREAVAQSMVLAVPVGAAYFPEIARLRAARRFWATVTDIPLWVEARTSRWNLTLYDPHTNLLRTTTEAMAAIIGGANEVAVGAFNEVPGADALARRLALNTHLLLREEAHLDAVSDPGAGSWYLEALTDEYAAALETGGEVAHEPQRVFVGTTRYANPLETAPGEPRVSGRATERIEHIRLATDAYTARTGRRPKVLLLMGGDARMRRLRAEFARNFFAPAGFAIEESTDGHEADLIVLCAADGDYLELARQVRPWSLGPSLVAGKLKEGAEELEKMGIRGFIHLGSDQLAVLEQWQKNLGIRE